MTSIRDQGPFFSAVAVGVLLVLCWFVYQPATGSVFLLDDHQNLGGLESVTDLESAIDYMGTGTAGPLGRPVALASFAPQASSWDEDPAAFLRVNILIHLLNGLLLYLFFGRLSRALEFTETDARFLALAASALWLFMPLLASSSLLIVQRMTTLSATFVLVGLNVYLLARQKIEANPDRSLVLMSVALVFATTLAALTKENGALLPTLVLVMELTLLKRPDLGTSLKWRVWTAVFLVVPTVVVLWYLASAIPYSESILARRDYTAFERLITQTHILWEYLFNAFIPRPANLGPFHDAYPVTRTVFEPSTLAALGAWIILIASALVYRRRFPIAAFAVLWYVSGHLLESTTLSLELYFEHRNYFPLIGPVFALCVVAWRVPESLRLIARVGLTAYLLVNAAILFSVTSLWGQPMIAAGNWYANAPESMRAVSNLANRQIHEMGSIVGAMTLQDFARQHPEHAYLGIPQLAISCNVRPDIDHSDVVQHLRDSLPTTGFSFTAGEMLDTLQSVILKRPCNGVDRQVIAELAATIMQNPRYRKDQIYSQYHQQLLARLAWDSDDISKAIKHLRNAHELMPDADINSMMVTALLADGRFDEARGFVAEAAELLPLHPLRRRKIGKDLAELSRYIDEVERESVENEPEQRDGLAQYQRN